MRPDLFSSLIISDAIISEAEPHIRYVVPCLCALSLITATTGVFFFCFCDASVIAKHCVQKIRRVNPKSPSLIKLFILIPLNSHFPT